MDGFLYIATPYTNYPLGISAAHSLALKAQTAFVRAGIPVFVPIVHTHSVGCWEPLPADTWLKQDFAVLKHAKALVVIKADGWAESEGVNQEIMFAKDNRIPVLYLSPDWTEEDPKVLAAFILYELDHPTPSRRVVDAPDQPAHRTFDTGATRDLDAGKPDYEGFLSPLVIEAFGRYMTKHRKMADGSIRASDNWQKGIPFGVYMKSAWRHFMAWWSAHRWGGGDVEEAICALIFNAQGYLHELLRNKRDLPDLPVGKGSPGSGVQG